MQAYIPFLPSMSDVNKYIVTLLYNIILNPLFLLVHSERSFGRL